MSETFTGKHGTVFQIEGDKVVAGEMASFGFYPLSSPIPLTDLLEFADSIEQRETILDAELYIYEMQSEDIDEPLSDEFMEQVKEQRRYLESL